LDSLWIVTSLKEWGKRLTRSFLAAVAFYTTIPLPRGSQLEFERIARWSPAIGLLLGGLLGLLDRALAVFGIPVLTRSALVVAGWVVLTGGLHLDGAIDVADGLAVSDGKRRLEVMQDSVTGAFGVMAAAIALLLKTAALSDLAAERCFSLMVAAGWGRWGQVVAIACYPYLKATGKGAFHKPGMRLPQDILVGWLLLLGLSGLDSILMPDHLWLGWASAGAGSAIALLTGFWFYCQLGGHTGDTYGAVVEWTEVFVLIAMGLLA
jgi:adenosylcobinamide-GDP ribazoletransferase